MPVRAPRLGGVALFTVLSFSIPQLALAQVSSPDDLCAPDADPCVVSNAQQLASPVLLDFGERTLQISPSGRLMSAGGSVVIHARTLQVDAGGLISVKGATAPTNGPGGDLDFSIMDTATVAGTLDASGSEPGEITILATRFDLSSGANVLVNGASGASGDSGGQFDVDADEINLGGTVRVNAGGGGSGGTIIAQAATVMTVAGVVEALGGGSGGGIVDLSSGGNLSVITNAIIRLFDLSSAGGDLTLSAGDVFLGAALGDLVMQGALSVSGGGEEGDDGGSMDLSAANGCRLTGQISAVSGTDGSGGDVSLSCSESGPGDMMMSALIDVHGNGTDASGGLVELATTDGSIEIANRITASAANGGGGEVDVSASRALTLADRINVNSNGSAGGAVLLTAGDGEDAILTLTNLGSINADGNGPDGMGGNISLTACTTRIQLRPGGAQSCTALGTSGTITLTGVNRIQIAGRLTTGTDGVIELNYRDVDPFLESTAVLSPTGIETLDESLVGCGTPAPTRTRTRTPTVPTPTNTPFRPTPTFTATRMKTPTPTGPKPTATTTPTPAGPTDTNCDGVIEADETEVIVNAIFDPSFIVTCPNADANDDSSATAADLPAYYREVAAAP